MAAGVSGRSIRVERVDAARGSVSWLCGRRQGVVPARLLGDMVKVIAYESRR